MNNNLLNYNCEWGIHAWICILLSAPQKLQASVVMSLWMGNPCQLEGEKWVEVLQQSVHHLLSEGGRGHLLFPYLIVSTSRNTQTQITEVCLLRAKT